MLSTLLQSIGLGIAGIDPLGAVLLMTAIQAGIDRSKIIALILSTFLTTVIFGVVIALVGQQVVASIIPSAESAIWAYLELAVAAVIGYWLFLKWSGPPKAKQEKKQQAIDGDVWAYLLAGAAFSITSVLDPTFLAVAVVVADTKSMWISISAFTLWILISQFMLFGLFVAYLFGIHQRLIDQTQGLWEKYKRLFRQLLHVAAILAILLLVLDASYYFVNGIYFDL